MKVNPATLKFQELVRHPNIDGFGVTSVAIQVAKELWLGSVRGHRHRNIMTGQHRIHLEETC